jgi:hypothetical protein
LIADLIVNAKGLSERFSPRALCYLIHIRISYRNLELYAGALPLPLVPPLESLLAEFAKGLRISKTFNHCYFKFLKGVWGELLSRSSPHTYSMF